MDDERVWAVPLSLDLERLQRGTHPLRAIARLAPDVTLARAQAELDVIAGGVRRHRLRSEQCPDDAYETRGRTVPVPGTAIVIPGDESIGIRDGRCRRS